VGALVEYCERERRAPDLLFGIKNEKATTSEVRFNPVVLLAVARDQTASITAQGKESAKSLADILGALLRVFCCRPWGNRLGEIGYTNAIGDLITVGLFKPGPRHCREISLFMLDGKWQQF
jgi:hypothetical protein